MSLKIVLKPVVRLCVFPMSLRVGALCFGSHKIRDISAMLLLRHWHTVSNVE